MLKWCLKAPCGGETVVWFSTCVDNLVKGWVVVINWVDADVVRFDELALPPSYPSNMSSMVRVLGIFVVRVLITVVCAAVVFAVSSLLVMFGSLDSLWWPVVGSWTLFPLMFTDKVMPCTETTKIVQSSLHETSLKVKSNYTRPVQTQAGTTQTGTIKFTWDQSESMKWLHETGMNLNR